MADMLCARHILTPSGWIKNGVIRWDSEGCITDISTDGYDASAALGTVIPGVANVHTHSFQRAMAGLAESRGPTGADDFWSWRDVMYRFLVLLKPEHIEAIAAQVQMEMALAGYTASAEFHYLHHQSDGSQYADPAQSSCSILAAAQTSGIGLTHLPVLYSYAGVGAKPLGNGQARFGCNTSQFERLYAHIAEAAKAMPADFQLGVAPHSLRAVDGPGIAACLSLCPQGPVHIHAAEQQAEVTEVEAHLGARPVGWLLHNFPLDERWCLIHATHVDGSEIDGMAKARLVAGLCPTTEANLGDGIFPATAFQAKGGRFAVGSDSNIRLSLTEELRMLELSQRLALRQRILLTGDTGCGNGRALIEAAASGGAQAVGRNAGAIECGRLADIVALRDAQPLLDWRDPDRRLDSWIFASEDRAVSDVWSAGRHIVRGGEHIREAAIRDSFRQCMRELKEAL